MDAYASSKQTALSLCHPMYHHVSLSQVWPGQQQLSTNMLTLRDGQFMMETRGTMQLLDNAIYWWLTWMSLPVTMWGHVGEFLRRQHWPVLQTPTHCLPPHTISVTLDFLLPLAVTTSLLAQTWNRMTTTQSDKCKVCCWQHRITAAMFNYSSSVTWPLNHLLHSPFTGGHEIPRVPTPLPTAKPIIWHRHIRVLYCVVLVIRGLCRGCAKRRKLA